MHFVNKEHSNTTTTSGCSHQRMLISCVRKLGQASLDNQSGTPNKHTLQPRDLALSWQTTRGKEAQDVCTQQTRDRSCEGAHALSKAHYTDGAGDEMFVCCEQSTEPMHVQTLKQTADALCSKGASRRCKALEASTTLCVRQLCGEQK